MEDPMKSDVEYTRTVKQRIRELGADLVGIADLEPLRKLEFIEPTDLLKPFSRAISIGVQLPASAFEMITDQPTPIYSNIYNTANRLLDELAFKTAVALQKDGYNSLPVPASQLLDWDKLYGAISHKAVARIAGLGWQGKNLLLITPQYGSRVRLVTVLTDAPLQTDEPLQNRCGKCMLCRDACPVGAIKGISTKDNYSTREEAIYLDRCSKKLIEEFAKLEGIGFPICGICIKACPYGKKVKGKK
jgi:epoxyqueuosine reductase QueG